MTAQTLQRWDNVLCTAKCADMHACPLLRSCALRLVCDAVWYKQEARLPRSVYESYPWQIFKWFVSHAQLNVYAQPFMLQKWHLCWANARAFHFAPHIFGFALCALGAVLPNPRRKESTNGKRGVSKTD